MSFSYSTFGFLRANVTIEFHIVHWHSVWIHCFTKYYADQAPLKAAQLLLKSNPIIVLLFIQNCFQGKNYKYIKYLSCCFHVHNTIYFRVLWQFQKITDIVQIVVNSYLFWSSLLIFFHKIWDWISTIFNISTKAKKWNYCAPAVPFSQLSVQQWFQLFWYWYVCLAKVVNGSCMLWRITQGI